MSDFDIFPILDEPATVERASKAIATKAAAEVALDDIDLTKLAVAHFEPSRAAVKLAAEKLTDVVHDLATPGKLAEAKSLRHRLIGIPLAEARKVEKALKAKLTAASKAVGGELASIEGDFETVESHITPQIEARDAQVAAEKAERDRIEAERVAGHRSNIAVLAGYVAQAQGRTSDQILTMINGVALIEIPPEQWEEFAVGAEIQKAETLEALQALFDRTKTAEDEAAAREAQRIENERISAELAEKESLLAEKQAEVDRKLAAIEAAEKAEANRVAAARKAAAEATAADIRGIWEAARCIEGPRVGYVLKAQGYFESGAGDRFANDQRPEIIAALRDARVEMQDKMRAAEEREAQDRASEANRLAQEAAAESLQLAVDATPQELVADAYGKNLSPIADAEIPAPPPAADMDEVTEKPWAMPSGPVTFASPEPTDPLPALLAHIAGAFDSKFASHPKPLPAWWGELRRLSDDVRALVAD